MLYRTMTALFLLALPPLAKAQTPPPPEREHGMPVRGNPRRPAEHWLEYLQKSNPEEAARLKALRESDPEAFGNEMRQRIQNRTSERLFQASPRLRDLITSLPADEREALLQELRRFPRGGDSEHRHGSYGPQRDIPVRPDPSTEDAAHGSEPACASMPRPEMEAAYDLRTRRIESEIERLGTQLETLRSMLEERKSKRDQVIDDIIKRQQLRPIAP